MSLYTKIDSHTIQALTSPFDIGQLHDWKVLTGGAENTNTYLETEKGKFVLTLCEQKTEMEARQLTLLLEHLAENNFETTTIFPNKNEEKISFFEGKPILLKSYLEGKVLEDFNGDLLKKTGTKLAQLNLISSPPYLPKQFSYGKEQFHLVFSIEHPFVNWLKKMHAFLLENIAPNLPKSLIHGDIFKSNIIVSDAGIPIIMDFEEACHYYRIFDLGMAAVGLCTVKGKLDLEKLQHLKAGYEKVLPLTPLEKKQLNLFIIYAATATAFWRFRQFNVLVLTENLKKQYKGMQGIANQVMEMAYGIV